MSGIYTEWPDSDPPDRSVVADVLLRQEPDEEEDEEEDDGENEERMRTATRSDPLALSIQIAAVEA
jgi:hypothetical protein